eukprot:7126504-Ditylum_brightwellii.AAC.1
MDLPLKMILVHRYMFHRYQHRHRHPPPLHLYMLAQVIMEAFDPALGMIDVKGKKCVVELVIMIKTHSLTVLT